MDKTELAALLGRPLTPIEDENFDTYLEIATEALEGLICTSVEAYSEPDRVYDVREGYSTVFTDIFTEIDEVKLDGEVVSSDNYSVRQWDKRTGDWYNSIVFEERMGSDDKELEVSATWGFDTMPSDLQLVLAGLFDQITRKNKYDGTITEKRVEDFAVRFKADADLDDEFVRKYSKTLSKYSLCDIPYVRHGKTRRWNRY